MEDVAHDSLVRHFGMIGVRVIDRVIFALAHVRSKRFAVIVVALWLCWLLCFPLGNKIGKPGIRTCGVIWWVAQVQDILIGAVGKPSILRNSGSWSFSSSFSVKCFRRASSFSKVMPKTSHLAFGRSCRLINERV